jgi:methionyl-tRNA formyltransferase
MVLKTADGEERLKVLNAVAVQASGAPGDTLDDALTIACGEGAVRLTEVQRAGKRPATAREFLRGYPVPRGTRFA